MPRNARSVISSRTETWRRSIRPAESTTRRTRGSPAAGPRVEPPLPVEVEWGDQPGDRERLARDVEALIRNRLSVRAAVTLVPPGSLERFETKSRLTRLAG